LLKYLSAVMVSFVLVLTKLFRKPKHPPPKETKINKSMKEKRPMLLDGSECRGNMTITKAELV